MRITRLLTLAIASLAGAAASAATLIADYQFHGSYVSAVAGAPDLVPLNTVTFTTAIIHGQPTDVAAFTQGSGLRMAAPGGISTTGYSIIVQVALDDTDHFRKLIDYKDLADDWGLYDLNGQLFFYPVAGGVPGAIVASTFAQIAMTRDATGQVTGYVNGVQQFTFPDTSNFSVLATTAFNLFVDDALSSGTEASAGRVARVRLYSGALSALEILALTGCYANCDGSIGSPLLNVNDFVCFQSRFAAAEAYADCDESGTLNVNDFVCFQSRFAAGCG